MGSKSPLLVLCLVAYIASTILPKEAWSSGQSGRLWIIEAGGPGFDSSSDQVVFSSLLGHRR